MKLFENASLGPLSLRNRIVMPPMAMLFGNRDGTVSERSIAYYARRALGGAALIIVENTAVHPGGVNYPCTLEIHDDKFADGLTKLASAIKSGGAAAAIQLFHPGRQIHPKFAGNYPIAPSPIPCPVMGGAPKELDADEIKNLVKCFVSGAVRAKEAGFDAVEIHGAHGYLVAQFLSPLSNRRTDSYGGDPQRRARFAIEIIEGIREKVGDYFPVILRISADEKIAGGLTLEQTMEMIPYLQKGLTALHVSAGCYPSMEWVVQPYLRPQGCLVELARAVRKAADVPILTVGRINNPQLANSIIEEGAADFVSVGRALIADPDFPNKALEGKFSEIRPCIACNMCIETVGINKTRCAVNPQMGHEAGAILAPISDCRFPISDLNHKSKIINRKSIKALVVGGGPAGMDAALTAKALGHIVWLAEAGEALGGQLALAGVPGSKAEIRKLLDYYRLAIEQSGVSVLLNRRVDTDTIMELKPDHVIIATGAVPMRFPSAENTPQKAKIIQAVDVLREKRELPGNVAVIGGGPVGLDVAEYLADMGSKVTAIEMKKRAGGNLEWNTSKMKIAALQEKGVTLLVKSKVVRVQPQSSMVYINSEGIEYTIGADFIVLALGSEPDNNLKSKIENLKPEIKVTVIGDCKEPRGLADAISEGSEAALRL